jgi:putative aminopeptidase FrvX
MDEKFLKEYLNSYGPVGFEYELGTQKIWIDKMREYVDSIEMDSYGTAWTTSGSGDWNVVIEAHCDEISYLVKYIDPKGYIKVLPNGGSDPHIAPSMRVKIWTENGPIDGIIGCAPIHIERKKESTKLDDIWIDVGLSSKSAVNRAGISVGNPVTFSDGFIKLGKFYTGRALDNRIGGFILTEVAKKLKEEGIKLPFKLHFVNAVQEEVGLRGAQMISNRLKPDLALIIDVCHETSSPHYKSSILGEMIAGDGPVITVAPSCHNNVRKKVIDVAKANSIPFQIKASSRSSGTDTESFAYSGNGVPSQLISIPLKYMHTTVETCSKSDVKNLVNLLYKTLLSIESGENFNYDRKIN